MAKLENHYPGNESWDMYSALYKILWTGDEFQAKLLSELNSKLDIAQVVFGIFKCESLNWIKLPVPALKGLSAKECLGQGLEKRLKTMLMRLPQ